MKHRKDSILAALCGITSIAMSYGSVLATSLNDLGFATFFQVASLITGICAATLLISNTNGGR
jgi:hypothetical protein